MTDLSFMADLQDLFDRQVTIEPIQTRDGYSKPAFGPPVSYPARLPSMLKAVSIRNKEGLAIAGRGPIYLNTTAQITVQDRLTLPAGYEPSQPPILYVTPVDDESGAIVTQLVVG